MVPESNLEEGLRRCRKGEVAWGTRVEEDRISFSLRGGSAAERESFFADLVAFFDPTRIRAGETRPAQLLTEALLARTATLVVVESCTGGLISKYVTDLSGQLPGLLGRVRNLRQLRQELPPGSARRRCSSATVPYRSRRRAPWHGERWSTLRPRLRSR